jgi:hypothetical protein
MSHASKKESYHSFWGQNASKSPANDSNKKKLKCGLREIEGGFIDEASVSGDWPFKSGNPSSVSGDPLSKSRHLKPVCADTEPESKDTESKSADLKPRSAGSHASSADTGR